MSPLANRLLFLAAVGLLLGMTPRPASRGAEAESDKQPTKKPPDAAEINRLIEQLGSAKFAEREAAAKALEAIGPPAVDALRKVDAQSKDPEIRRRVGLLLDKIENRFEQLVIDYKAYGLPLPPKDAKLVRFQVDAVVENGVEKETYSLGFLLNDSGQEEPATILWGTTKYETGRGSVVGSYDQSRFTTKEIASWVKDVNDPLPLSIQCEARGWHTFAQALWRKALKQTSEERLKSQLASTAWAYWHGELTNPATDRALIAKHLKALLAVEKQLDTRENRSLLKALEAALVPSKAKPGTVEALIEDLVESTYSRGMVGRRPDERPDPRYQKLLLKGFDAVPSLIDHLDDGRLTRGMSVGFNNFRSYNLRVKDVVSDLLQGLAGDEVGKSWLHRLRGQSLKKTDAKAWWDKAKKVGEERYLLEHVLPQAAWPNFDMLEIISAKYPTHLPKLYRTLLDKQPDMQSWPMTKAVTASSLSRDAKIDLFVYAGKHKNLEHRRAAFWELKDLDRQRFVELLIETLDSLPRTPTEPYWKCPEASFANLVMQTDDPRPWETLTKVARRCDVGLRIEMLERTTYYGPRQRKQRLDFLAKFLDDAEVRDIKTNSYMFEGPYAAGDFPRLEVRNHAATQIANILNLSADPKPDWSAEQWARLRAQVREALQREAAKSKANPAQETTPKRGQ